MARGALVLGFVLTAIALPVGSQQSLPSKGQCRVDEQYYGAQVQRDLFRGLQSAHGPKAAISGGGVSAKELAGRIKELTGCAVVDQENLQNYEEAASVFQSELEIREHDFINRHHMLSQFYAEDAKGLR